MTMTIGAVASSKAAAAGGAVRIDAVGDKYTRTATGLATNFTWTCWIKLAASRGTYSMAMCQDNGGANYYQLGTTSNGTTLARSTTSGGNHSTGYTLLVGTWVFAATVNDTSAGNDILGYKVAGGSWVNAAAGNATVTGPADANTFYIGNDGFNDWFNGSIAAVKVWSTVLTEAEIQAEAFTYAAVKTSGLWANYQFRNGPQTTDDSGNGRTLTAGGTLTLDSSGPPIT
jgi:hypothetical protein